MPGTSNIPRRLGRVCHLPKGGNPYIAYEEGGRSIMIAASALQGCEFELTEGKRVSFIVRSGGAGQDEAVSLKEVHKEKSARPDQLAAATPKEGTGEPEWPGFVPAGQRSLQQG